MQVQIVAVDLIQLPSRFYSDMERLMGVKNDLIDITDEKTNTNGIIRNVRHSCFFVLC